MRPKKGKARMANLFVSAACSALAAELTGLSIPASVAVVVAGAGEGPPAFSFPKEFAPRRLLLVVVGRPLQVKLLSLWREFAGGKEIAELKIEHVAEESPALHGSGLATRIGELLAEWKPVARAQEKVAIRSGEWVKLGDGHAASRDPDLVTLFFGPMADLLGEIDWIRDQFAQSCGRVREEFRHEVEKLMAKPEGREASSFKLPHPFADGRALGRLPSVLLLGATGVGKTLFARYLAGTGAFARVSVPEFLGSKSMFEYELFGYAKGAYTDGNPQGSPGLIASTAGGVLFLDEIGEASAAIQAKLLAYLDDYTIRPRGWMGEPFYAPTLVVAATNRDPEEADPVTGRPLLRADLRLRFTDVVTIPPLSKRMASLPLILDCLLQNPQVNPGGKVKAIGQGALEALSKKEYPGNFRELQDTLRNAIRRAVREDRDHLGAWDL